ncbi:MAG: phage exclusion protein Lit family protein [Sulfurovaceae bacterium]
MTKDSPIQSLWGNIIKTFETCGINTLQGHIEAVNLKQISKAIDYDTSQDKVRPPSSNTMTKRIYLQEIYLSHLWSMIYSLFVIYEEGIMKPISKQKWYGKIHYDSKILQRAMELFNWSCSLANKYSEWNEEFPNPRHYKNEEEEFYGLKVNGIFQDAVAYLMFHEFAHLTSGHSKYYIDAKNNNDTRIDIEKDADSSALSKLIQDHYSDKEKTFKILPILFVYISSFIIEPTEHQSISINHQNLDNRLLTLLQKVNIKDEREKFYVLYLASIGLRFYLEKLKLIKEEDMNQEFYTAEDLLSFYLSKIDIFREDILK